MDEQRLRPREKGPNDPHLGTIDRNFKCNTCEENMTECPGHFGVIKLATPVYHYGFMTKVKKILETVCHNCGKIKATDVSPLVQCRFASCANRRCSVGGSSACLVCS